ncbi:hypothetical protein LOK49_Contig6G00016 [Camellia lanceoleosa]|nr:hypothetical protein LOK49_Contig6G00016 [Camellia lanceoleosa]
MMMTTYRQIMKMTLMMLSPLKVLTMRAYQCHPNDWRSHLLNLRTRQLLFRMGIYMTMWRPNTHNQLMSI